MNKDQNPSKGILSGYKKVGSTFIPPLLHQLGPWEFISWYIQALPELVWWDILMDRGSPQFAAKVAEEIALHFKEQHERGRWWSFISDYAQLSREDFDRLNDRLARAGLLDRIIESLSPFFDLYPECPLTKLSKQSPAESAKNEYLVHFEARFAILQDKRSRDAVLVQAQAVYIGFMLGRLKVMQGLALADFPQVQYYPTTERSQEVGASICATVNMIAGNSLPKYEEDAWAQYFWRRSLELRPLNLAHLVNI